MAKNEVAIHLTAIDHASQVVAKLGTNVEAHMKRVEKATQRLSGFTSMMDKIALGVAGAVSAIGVASVKMGMDAVESENLFSVSMGNMSAKARAWSEGLRRNLGLNAYEVRKNVGMFNTMTSSMGLTTDQAYSVSTGLTQLAYDMASFYNLPTEEAFTKLRSGLSGEIEPLKALGVMVDENTVKTYAYANGIAKSGEDLTNAQKVMARYGVIMAATSNAQGDLARTIDSPSNKLRVFQQRIVNVGIDLGTALIPAFDRVLNAVDPLIKRLEQMATDGSLEKWGKKAEKAVQKVIDKVSETFTFITENWPEIKLVLEGFIGLWASAKLAKGLTNTYNTIKGISELVRIIGGSKILSTLITGGAAAMGLVSAALGLVAYASPDVKDPMGSSVDKWGKHKKTEKPKGASGLTASGRPVDPLIAKIEKAQADNDKANKRIQALLDKVKLNEQNPPKPKPKPDPKPEPPKDTGPTVPSILSDMVKDLAAAGRLEQQLGDQFDFNAEKANIFNRALQALSSQTTKDAGPAMDRVNARLRTVTSEINRTAAAEEARQAKADRAIEAAVARGEALTDLLTNGTKAQQMLRELNLELDTAARLESVLGDAYDYTGERVTILENKLQQLIEAGYGEGNSEVQGVRAQYEDAKQAKTDEDNQKEADKKALEKQQKRWDDTQTLIEKKTLEAIQKAKEKIEAWQGLKQNVLGNFGIANSAFQGAQSMAAAGPQGMLAGALVSIISESETFKNLLAIINPILQAAADAIGRLLEPLLPLFEILSVTLMPVLQMIGSMLANILMPIMQALFPVFKTLGIVVLWLARAIGWVYNTLLDIPAKILRWLSGLNLLGWRPFAGLAGVADRLDRMKVNLSNLDSALAELTAMTWDSAMAQAKLAKETAKLIGNEPEGFKSVLRAFQVADNVPRMASGGVVKASPSGTLALLGEGGEDEAVIPLSQLGGSGTVNYMSFKGAVIFGVDNVRRTIAQAMDQINGGETIAEFGLEGA
jgi:hypothetical protein